MCTNVDELLMRGKWEGKGAVTRQRLVTKLQGTVSISYLNISNNTGYLCMMVIICETGTCILLYFTSLKYINRRVM